MSCLGLKNHLLPYKKVRKNFSSTLRTKIQKLRLQSPHRRHLVYARRLHQQSSFAPVYVDEMFNRSSEAHIKHLVPPLEPPERKVFEKSTMREGMGIGSSSSSSSSLIGEMGEVDLRAELFITRFREEMRLQRQRSFGEYEEMLARGT